LPLIYASVSFGVCARPEIYKIQRHFPDLVKQATPYDRDCRRGRTAGRRDGRDRPQHPARRRRHQRGVQQYRRRQRGLGKGRSAANAVLDASGALRREADILRDEIHAFVGNIRVA
jgi:hypothetical protein